MGFFTNLAQYGYNDSSYYYTNTTNVDSETSAAAALGILLFIVIFSLIIYAVSSYFLSRIFKKAGIAPWAAWVPFYNNWKLLEIGGQQGFWAVLAIIPVVNIVAAIFMYIAMYNIGLKLGKEGVFVLLAIFVAPVWLIWLAVDKSTWNDAAGAPSLAARETPPTSPTDAGTPPVQPTPPTPPTTPPTPPTPTV